MRAIKKIILFTLILIVLSGLYVLFAPHQSGLPHGSWRRGVGEAAGGLLSWLFVIIYGRTLLKIVAKNGPLLERLLPETAVRGTSSLLKKIIRFLNRTHPYVGAAAVLLVLGHAWLEGFDKANLLMLIIIFLALWQFAFGLFLLSRYQAVFVKKLKRYGYMAHSQLYTGIAIGVFALFGHLLVGG